MRFIKKKKTSAKVFEAFKKALKENEGFIPEDIYETFRSFNGIFQKTLKIVDN